jgi:hypothetical protein
MRQVGVAALSGCFGSVGQAQAQMFAVIDGLVQQLGDVVVVEAVDDAATCTSTCD